MTSCLHSNRHGYMAASPDLRKVTGQFPQLCQEWSRHVNNSAYVGVLFFDLRKAFDRVWRDSLL